MSDCCLTNLGCLQIPTTVIGSQGQAGANGSVWLNGAGVPSNTLGNNGDYYINTDNGDVYVKAAGVYTIALNIEGAAGSQGEPGFSRVAYSLAPVNSGSGSPKTFITESIASGDMPVTEGSSLLLTFNVKTNNTGNTLDRLIGIRFGGQECIVGLNNAVFISGGQLETQVKVEIIRNDTIDEAYVRVSFYGIDFGSGPISYNESNFISGLNFYNF